MIVYCRIAKLGNTNFSALLNQGDYITTSLFPQYFSAIFSLFLPESTHQCYCMLNIPLLFCDCHLM